LPWMKCSLEHSSNTWRRSAVHRHSRWKRLHVLLVCSHASKCGFLEITFR